MDTGREVKIHTDVPAPQEQPIPAPDWPVKKPEEVPAEVEEA